MFPRRYFALRFFAAVYWPQSQGQASVPPVPDNSYVTVGANGTELPPRIIIQVAHGALTISGGGIVEMKGHKENEEPSSNDKAFAFLLTFA